MNSRTYEVGRCVYQFKPPKNFGVSNFWGYPTFIQPAKSQRFHWPLFAAVVFGFCTGVLVDAIFELSPEIWETIGQR